MKWFPFLVMLMVALGVRADSDLAAVQFDRSAAALKRGAEVVTSVCMGCHSLQYVRYRELSGIGFTLDEVNALRGERAIEDALLAALSDDDALQTFGLIPPDQSLLAKARAGGANYIYAFVTGYEKNAQGEVINTVFPGVKMPDILDYASADAAQRATLQQQARDAAVFLEWASDPRAAERRRLGYFVIAYLVLLTLMLYLLKRRVWAKLPPLSKNVLSP